MSISILIEPNALGYRASTKSPVEISAEGSTEEEAIGRLRNELFERIGPNGRIVEFPLLDLNRLAQTATAVGEHPLFEEYLAAVEEYRRTANAVPN